MRLAAIEVVGKLGDASSVRHAAGNCQRLGRANCRKPRRPRSLSFRARSERRIGPPRGRRKRQVAGDPDSTRLAQRRIDATPHLVKALNHSDEAVRRAALKALGATAGPKDLVVLISAVNEAEERSRRGHRLAGAARRRAFACRIEKPRRPNLPARWTARIAATKARLLRILGAMGGPKALATIAVAAKSDDAQLQDAGTRVLGEWMTADAAEPLYEIASERSQVQDACAARLLAHCAAARLAG